MFLFFLDSKWNILGFGLVVRQTSSFKTSYLDITDVHTDVRKTAATQEERDATI